jgi:hypothetical protein
MIKNYASTLLSLEDLLLLGEPAGNSAFIETIIQQINFTLPQERIKNKQFILNVV